MTRIEEIESRMIERAHLGKFNEPTATDIAYLLAEVKRMREALEKDRRLLKRFARLCKKIEFYEPETSVYLKDARRLNAALKSKE